MQPHLPAAPDRRSPHHGSVLSRINWGRTVEVLDLFGLSDPLTSHLSLARRGAIAGHEKPLPTAWAAAVLGLSGRSIDQLDALQSQRRRPSRR